MACRFIQVYTVYLKYLFRRFQYAYAKSNVWFLREVPLPKLFTLWISLVKIFIFFLFSKNTAIFSIFFDGIEASDNVINIHANSSTCVIKATFSIQNNFEISISLIIHDLSKLYGWDGIFGIIWVWWLT